MRITVVAVVDGKTKMLFEYEAAHAPCVGDDIALAIDDEGFLTTVVEDVLHIPLKWPRPAQAQVAISTLDLAVARWVADRKPMKHAPQGFCAVGAVGGIDYVVVNVVKPGSLNNHVGAMPVCLVSNDNSNVRVFGDDDQLVAERERLPWCSWELRPLASLRCPHGCICSTCVAARSAERTAP